MCRDGLQSSPGDLKVSAEPAKPTLHMVGIRELVKQRTPLDAVSVLQLGNVRRQRLRVARDVQDPLETPGQLAGIRVHPRPRRVDEHRTELVALKVDAFQPAERPHLIQRLGQLFCRQAHQPHVIYSVLVEVAQRGIDRGLADFRGQHLAHAGGQRQGEVAVAAVKLQKVVLAFAHGLEGPAQHLLVHRAVGLGERAFRLAVAEHTASDFEFFHRVVSADDQAFALGAADNADAQVFGQLPCGRFPRLVQRAVVAQGDHGIASQGGEELHLEQAVAQLLAGLPGRLQARHQCIDALAGDREVLDQDRLVLLARGEHGVVALAILAPQAEFGAQAVMLARRVENSRLRRAERRQQLAQPGHLGVQLGGVGGGVESSTHALNQPSLMTNRMERITRAGFRSRWRPEISLTAVQEMKPKAMPLAIE